MSTCRSCQATVVWCWTRRRVRTPIDPEPVEDGNVTVEGGGPLVDGVTVLVGEPPGLFENPELRYRTHFVTCPDADRWRKNPHQ